MVLSERVASTEKVQNEPLLETTAKSRKDTPTVANQCWSQAIWGPDHGSCLDPNRAQIKPLVHLATGQAVVLQPWMYELWYTRFMIPG